MLKGNKLISPEYIRNEEALKTYINNYSIRPNIIQQASVTRRGPSSIIILFVVVSQISVTVVSAAFMVRRWVQA